MNELYLPGVQPRRPPWGGLTPPPPHRQKSGDLPKPLADRLLVQIPIVQCIYICGTNQSVELSSTWFQKVAKYITSLHLSTLDLPRKRTNALHITLM